eukprot:TRINITY_DN966_c0_g1_i1.p1 TRINITY_DN966_c0_g1~~TRINITY_DN966_c0_g1_i1.p1  ORF type:complete len:193 (+),score=77.83 TRINITY_DN966_c0_g1_i1:45-581(+)
MESDTKPIKINNYDTVAVKQLLDDQIIKLMNDEEDYTEDTRLSDLKLVLGAISCVLAVVSHFYPLPFPANLSLLIACSVSYFVLSAVLQYIASYIERDSIYASSLKDTRKPGARVRTQLGKYEHEYRIVIESRTKSQRVEVKQSIAAWFDAQGVFNRTAFTNAYRGLLRTFEANEKRK